MKDLQEVEENELKEAGEQNTILDAKLQRRAFLRYAGASAAAVSLLAVGCKKDEAASARDRALNEPVKFTKDDFGVLNYAYALEQLEAAFYTQVMATPYAGITTAETLFLRDIRDHEIAHREFFKAALGDNAIRSLEVDFSSISFGNRDSVLGTAKAFEDLGVSAYNGAGKLLQSQDYLLLAGKIVSVEARHAALIRDLISNGTFADNSVVNNMGLDVLRTPAEVLDIAGTYIKTKIDASNLPTS